MFIKINSISRYAHVSDDYVIEDKPVYPMVKNQRTGEELHWQKSGGSDQVVYVIKKDGKNTCISSNIISEEYDNRHPF